MSIEVNALTLDGSDGATLTASWTYAPALLTEEEVRDLAQRWFRALAALVRHAEQPNAGGRTPSDLPLVALSQDEIEGLERHYPQLEDILPLSPLQEGLLFHALYDARAPDVYTVQLVLSLQGRLDEEALKAAAQALIERHAGLRAAFRHEGLSRPVQIIVPGRAGALAQHRPVVARRRRPRAAAGRHLGGRPRRALRRGLPAAPPVCADPAVGR